MFLFAIALAGGATAPHTPAAAQSPAPATVQATRTDTPPVLDGRDDDAIWQQIAPIGGFREVRPSEDGDPRQATEFRVAYDDANL
ncbi:MAG TPA: hypothetical protein PLL69_04605, partial [Gemmatimonadales bacterium]|nr:hypothetical protein [Gemmatimonadales bacterium]